MFNNPYDFSKTTNINSKYILISIDKTKLQPVLKRLFVSFGNLSYSQINPQVDNDATQSDLQLKVQSSKSTILTKTKTLSFIKDTSNQNSQINIYLALSVYKNDTTNKCSITFPNNSFSMKPYDIQFYQIVAFANIGISNFTIQVSCDKADMIFITAKEVSSDYKNVNASNLSSTQDYKYSYVSSTSFQIFSINTFLSGIKSAQVSYAVALKQTETSYTFDYSFFFSPSSVSINLKSSTLDKQNNPMVDLIIAPGIYYDIYLFATDATSGFTQLYIIKTYPYKISTAKIVLSAISGLIFLLSLALLGLVIYRKVLDDKEIKQSKLNEEEMMELMQKDLKKD